MRLLIVGANGGIGRQAVEQALTAGHHVTAVLRTPSKLELRHPALDIVRGDVLLPGSFEKYLMGTDAVISAIGGKMTVPTTLYSKGNQHLIHAMNLAGVRRVFFISSSAIEISPSLPFYVRLAEKYVLQKILKHGYADQRVMESIVKSSDLDWTIMRPPQLTNKPATGVYRYAANRFLKNALKISRADAAHFILHHLQDKEIYRSVVEMGY